MRHDEIFGEQFFVRGSATIVVVVLAKDQSGRHFVPQTRSEGTLEPIDFRTQFPPCFAHKQRTLGQREFGEWSLIRVRRDSCRDGGGGNRCLPIGMVLSEVMPIHSMKHRCSDAGLWVDAYRLENVTKDAFTLSSVETDGFPGPIQHRQEVGITRQRCWLVEVSDVFVSGIAGPSSA